MRTGIGVTWCPCAVPLNTTLVLGFLRSMSPVCERACEPPGISWTDG